MKTHFLDSVHAPSSWFVRNRKRMLKLLDRREISGRETHNFLKSNQISLTVDKASGVFLISSTCRTHYNKYPSATNFPPRRALQIVVLITTLARKVTQNRGARRTAAVDVPTRIGGAAKTAAVRGQEARGPWPHWGHLLGPAHCSCYRLQHTYDISYAVLYTPLRAISYTRLHRAGM